MKKKLKKKEIEKKILEFFKNISKKTPKEIKKIKRISMTYKIPLKNKRKLFCKKCFNPYINPKIRIKNKMKIIICKNCESVSRWKLK